jgi:hypothetical protein
MKLVLKRRFLGEDYTIGRLYLSPFHLSPNPSPQGRRENSAGPSSQGRGENSAGATMRDSDVMTTNDNSVTENPTTANVTGEISTASAPLPLWGAAGGRGELEYFCDTLEDKDRGLRDDMPLDEIRKIKIPHETAIPTGVYKIIVNLSPSKRRMLPRLSDVPGFSGILIHRGNTKRDSSGCILVGENKVKGRVINSAQYEKRLVEMLTEAQERGEEITIKITYNK